MKKIALPFKIIFSLLFVLQNAFVYSQTEADKVLLKNYRPKNLFNVAKSNIERAKYPIIDMHSHAYAKTPEEVAQWVKNMDKVGVQKTIVLSSAYGERFDSIYELYSKYPDRFEVWCGIDYSKCGEPDFAEHAIAELERCFKVGANGVGELSDKGKGLLGRRTSNCGAVHADAPVMDPIWEKCAELGMPVNIHVGEPIWFYEPMDSTNDGLMQSFRWRIDNDMEGRLILKEIVKTLENTLVKHPNTTFIACHLANCNHDLTMLGDLFDKYPNLYADVSARVQYLVTTPRYAVKFIERYQNKLFFGTDKGYSEYMYKVFLRMLESDDEHYYEIDFYHLFWPFYGLHLKDEILKKLYNGNALKISKL